MKRACLHSASLVLIGALALAASSDSSGEETLRVTTLATSEPLRSNGRLGGVSVGATGSVYVANFGGSVWRVAPAGTVTALARGFQGSSGNAVDRDGNLYQASFLDGRIARIAPDGSVADLVSSGLEGPVGLSVADDGSLYVCACRGNTVERVAPDGSVATFARHEDLDCPNGLARRPDGALYVVSYNNGHVVRIDASGAARRFATLPDGRNAHIAWARGAFWITKIEANRLYRLGLDGVAERYAGSGALGFEDGPVADAPLARPNGIAATPDGRALVVNTLDGPWRGEEETRIVLRRVDLPSDARQGAGAPLLRPVGSRTTSSAL